MDYYNNKKNNYKTSSFVLLWLLLFMVSVTPNLAGVEKPSYPATSLSFQDTVVIDFDNGKFDAGDIVSVINSAGVDISVFGSNPDLPDQNAAMIFNSSNPTGGDFDLGTPNEFFGGPGMNFEGSPVPSNNVPLNNVIIVSEDLNSAEPDDASATSISLTFDFSKPVTIISMDLLDLDSGNAVLHLFDSLGNEIYSEAVPETGCNGVANIVISVPGVSKMVVALNGSGALDNIKFIVENDSNNNVGFQANDDVYETFPDSILVIDAPGVLENDVAGGEEDLLIVEHDSISIAGGVVSLRTDGGFSYVPPVGFTGIDSFNYTISNGGDTQDSATVSIAVKAPSNRNPNAVDDNYSTEVDSVLVIDPPGVLGNDSDPDGDELIIIFQDSTTTAGGTLGLDTDGGFIYNSPDSFEGDDSFTYVVTDGSGGTDTAQVNISVIKNATDPVANDDVYSTGLNTELTILAPGVLSNDTDPNGDELTVIYYDQIGTVGGIVQMNPDGGFNYTPAEDSLSTDTFTYVVTDGNGNSDTATVFINFIMVVDVDANSPPNAVEDQYMTDQDLELSVTNPAEGLLANDSDPDGDQIFAVEVNDAVTGQGGRVSINSDGTFTFVPGLGFVGTDTFEYTVCDDQEPALCDSATAFIEVKELPVEVFNAFTPNGDGLNDTWIIQGITRFPDNEVQIFNRWGNLVFKVTGYNNTTKVWDGNSSEGIVFGSNGAPDGAYFYVITLGDGSERISGYVVVRR